MTTSRGRPRLASHELLQEAAFELFQLRGYRNTSVERIAKTAGFSRATFFNFFSSKSELFWVETDRLIDNLEGTLEASLGQAPVKPLSAALTAHANQLTSADIPWALQHFRLIDAGEDLIASGATRVLRLNQLFSRYLRATGAADSEVAPLEAEAGAASMTALLLVALRHWLDAGVGRGTLGSHLSPLLKTRAFK